MDLNAHKPFLSRGCRLRADRQAPVILVPEGLFRLSPGGLRVIELCDGERSAAEIISRLQADHSVDLAPRIASETESFLRRLLEKRILT